MNFGLLDSGLGGNGGGVGEDGVGDMGEGTVDSFEVGEEVEVDGAGFVGFGLAFVEALEVSVAEFFFVFVESFFVPEELGGEGAVAGGEGGDGDFEILDDFLVEVGEFAFAFFGEDGAEADFFEDEFGEVFVDDVADGFEFAEEAELAHLVGGVVVVDFFFDEAGEEGLDFGVELVDEVIAFGDGAGEWFVVVFEGDPGVVEHGADDFGHVDQFAEGLAEGEGGSADGAVVDESGAEGFGAVGGFGDEFFHESGGPGDTGEATEGEEEVVAGVELGDDHGDVGGGWFGESILDDHEDEDEGEGDGAFEEEHGEGETAGFDVVPPDEESGDGHADIGAEDEGDDDAEFDAGGGGEPDEEPDGGGGGLEEGGEDGGEDGEDEGIFASEFDEFDEVGLFGEVAGGDGIVDDAHGEEDEAEGEEDLADAPGAGGFGELVEDDAEEDGDGGVLVDVEGEELDEDGEADVGAEHEGEELAGGHLPMLYGLYGEEGHGGGGGADDGEAEAAEEGGAAGAGEAVHPDAEAAAEETVESSAEISDAEEEEGDAAGDSE